MSKSFGVPVFSVLRMLAGVSLFSVVGLGGVASAQNVPTLVPYTTKLIAGGGAGVYGAGVKCPSGLTSTDAYGDGCLATEIQIGNSAAGAKTPGSRSAAADTAGNVFFTDYNNGLVRRVDAVTGVVTAVAGGASASPALGKACGANTSTDASGDGCLGTLVKLSHPVSLVFAQNGDLYFSDYGLAQVRKIAATNNFITTSGVISLAVGNTSGTYGYAASNATTTITSANSYAKYPYGIAIDTKGDLFVVDESTQAILVLNTNTTGSNTVNGVPVAAGTIWKIAGTVSSGGPYCVNGTSGSYGCNYGLYVENVPANTDEFDNTYAVAVGPDGTVYGAVEYYDSIFQVSPAGILSTFAGIQNSVGTIPTLGHRGLSGSFGVGSSFGVTTDTGNDVYFTDASSGLIWRVDSGTHTSYAIAGGAATVCSTIVDAYGDGCPALQSTFGATGTSKSNYATATLPGPGIYGLTADANYNLYVGDTETNLVREVASGASFGVVAANQPTQTLDVHFAVGDSAASANAYALTIGAGNFSLGTATCTTNSDKTVDCLLPVTATPSVPGVFSATLTVTSNLGATNNFTLSGNYVQSPITRTVVSYTAPSLSCTGVSSFSPTTPIVLKATIAANGPAAPGGTVQFYANGAAIGTPQVISVGGTQSVPVYTSTLTYAFSTPNTYSVTAVYSGDSYFKASTSSGTTLVSSSPTFAASAITYQESSVVAGGTALYSFNLAQTVYAGTITFACSGLPSGAACSFSPSTVTANGCSTGNTVALSITTSQGYVTAGGFGGIGRGRWQWMTMLPAIAFALLFGLRRRRMGTHWSRIAMSLALLVGLSSLMACTGTKVAGTGSTPSGTSMVTVTATGSAGTTSSFTVPLTVK